jgi:protein TonB
MAALKKSKSKIIVWFGAAVMVLLLGGAATMAMKMLSAEDTQRRQRAVQSVTLLKPPPPPPPEKIKEKPPEPEIKKEEIIEHKQVEKPQEQPQEAKDAPPPGDRLGLDAEGGSGADGFGLLANKGGAALIGSGAGGGGGNLMGKYGWYAAIIQNDLRRLLQEYMEKNGGIPEGSCKVSLQIKLDDQGRVLSYKVVDACGNSRVDEAVNRVLQSARISEPPPGDMPKSIKIRISAKG